jgi:hypothetical protein
LYHILGPTVLLPSSPPDNNVREDLGSMVTVASYPFFVLVENTQQRKAAFAKLRDAHQKRVYDSYVKNIPKQGAGPLSICTFVIGLALTEAGVDDVVVLFFGSKMPLEIFDETIAPWVRVTPDCLFDVGTTYRVPGQIVLFHDNGWRPGPVAQGMGRLTIGNSFLGLGDDKSGYVQVTFPEAAVTVDNATAVDIVWYTT